METGNWKIETEKTSYAVTPSPSRSQPALF